MTNFLNAHFVRPEALALAIPLFLHAILMARRLGTLSASRLRVALGLRLAVLALLVLCVAGVRARRLADALTVFFVVDVSDSLPEDQANLAREYVRKTMAELDPKRDRAGVVVFGGDAALETSPTSLPEFERVESVVDRQATDIAGAIQLATACFVGDSQKRIVVVSDGNQNAGDAERAARAAAASDVALDVFPLSYRNRNDAVVEKVVVENRVGVEEPFNIRVVASATRSGPAKMRVYQDGWVAGEFDVTLEEGKKNAYTLPTQVKETGFHRFEVQIDADGDLIPENNRGFAFTYGRGEPRALLADGDASPSEALVAALRSENVAVDRVAPSDVPASLRELQAYDLLIFNNVGAGEFPPERMKTIETAVHEFGMGFVMIGGENSFGPGGYNDSPIEKLLPLDMEMKNEKILPKGAIVPVIHTVEIPQGQFWAEQVLLAALDVLSPQDEMGVLYYAWTGGESWLFPLQTVSNKGRLRGAIKGIQPGDMPSFDSTLKMAHEALKKSNAAVKHIVIVSDGDPQRPNAALVKSIQAEKISVSTVVIAPHSPSDATIMKNVAEWGGGNFYYPKKFDELPQIFIREAAVVRKSMLIEEPFHPVGNGYSPVLAGVAGYPELKGYVGTSPKELADVPLLTHKGDPLLAHWRHGVGKSVAFTSDAKERWAADWLGWTSYAKFWTQIARWAMRDPFDANYRVETTIEGGVGRVAIDATTTAGEFRNFVPVRGTVSAPDLSEQPLDFKQTSPGRYEATFRAERTGTYMFAAQAPDESGQGTDLVTGGTSIAYSPEFEDPASDEGLLYRLAETGGGRVLDADDPVFLHNLERAERSTPLWPWFLPVAMTLFLADVFVRRVLVGPREIAAGARAVRTRIAARVFRRPLREDTGTAALLKAKEGARGETATTLDDDRRREFLESLRKTKVEPEKPSARPKPIVPGAAPPPPTPPGGTGGAAEDQRLTSKLLKTRSQVRKRIDRGDRGAGPGDPPEGGER